MSTRRARDLSNSQLVKELAELLVNFQRNGELCTRQERRWASLIEELGRRQPLRLPECVCEECWPYSAAARSF